jgi:hypothetical protein
MGRGRSSRRIRDGLEDTRVTRQSEPPELIRNRVIQDTCLCSFPLSESSVCKSRVPEKVIKALVRVDLEIIEQEDVISKISTDRRVLDKSFDAEWSEHAWVTDTRELEDSRRSNCTSGENNFFLCGHG